MFRTGSWTVSSVDQRYVFDCTPEGLQSVRAVESVRPGHRRAHQLDIDGFAVDLLQFYVGIKDGEVVRRVPTSSGREQRPVTFRSSMQAHEIVAMYQTVVTADGSSFTLQKLEPAEFVGVRGFRFDFEVVRKFDEVRLSGVGYGAAVRNGELFAITYTAPRLGFFQRYAGQVESMAKSARVRG